MTSATTNPSIPLTGKIIEWHPAKGWGLIRSDRHTFFAHAKDFVGDCACGQRHKCEINPGMTVEFTVTQLVPTREHGKLPPAAEIRVKS